MITLDVFDELSIDLYNSRLPFKGQSSTATSLKAF